MKNATDEDRPLWLELMDAEGNREYRTFWRFPSGGFGEVSIQYSRDRRQRVTFTWDSPSRTDEDVRSLVNMVIPEVLSHAEQSAPTPDTTRPASMGSGALCRTPMSVLS